MQSASMCSAVAAGSAVMEPVLEVQGLVKHFLVRRRLRGADVVVHAVDGVDLIVGKRETVGLVGESGSGKTTVGRCALRLIEPTAGQICLEGEDITSLSAGRLRPLRRKMQMVFQDPADSLNPRFTFRHTLLDALHHAGICDGRERLQRAAALVEQVGLEPADLDKFPHQFSGGQQQRIAIARALAFEPVLLVLDEPTASLDVSVQTQITKLLRNLQDQLGHSYLLITHDLSVVRHITNRVAVMYLGKMVEVGDTREIFKNPLHPYTRALIGSAPIPDPAIKRKRIILSGEIPSPLNPPAGCRFHTRCASRVAVCSDIEPELLPSSQGHAVACHRWNEVTQPELSL